MSHIICQELPSEDESRNKLKLLLIYPRIPREYGHFLGVFSPQIGVREGFARGSAHDGVFEGVSRGSFRGERRSCLGREVEVWIRGAPGGVEEAGSRATSCPLRGGKGGAGDKSRRARGREGGSRGEARRWEGPPLCDRGALGRGGARLRRESWRHARRSSPGKPFYLSKRGPPGRARRSPEVFWGPGPLGGRAGGRRRRGRCSPGVFGALGLPRAGGRPAFSIGGAIFSAR
jgi:hypothetical protein